MPATAMWPGENADPLQVFVPKSSNINVVFPNQFAKIAAVRGLLWQRGLGCPGGE